SISVGGWSLSRARSSSWPMAVFVRLLCAPLVLFALVGGAGLSLARADEPRPPPLRVGDPVPQVLSPPPSNPPPAASPSVDRPPDLTLFNGQMIMRIDVNVDDGAWPLSAPPQVASVRPGQTLHPWVVRKL